MDRQPQAPQGTAGRDPCPDRRPGPHPYPGQEAQGRPALNIGPILVRTLRHFFPDFNTWLEELPDPRHPGRTRYEARFLLWTALMLFVCKLGSRRQIDYQFGEAGTQVLANLNRLAGPRQPGCRPPGAPPGGSPGRWIPPGRGWAVRRWPACGGTCCPGWYAGGCWTGRGCGAVSSSSSPAPATWCSATATASTA